MKIEATDQTFIDPHLVTLELCRAALIVLIGKNHDVAEAIHLAERTGRLYKCPWLVKEVRSYKETGVFSGGTYRVVEPEVKIELDEKGRPKMTVSKLPGKRFYRRNNLKRDLAWLYQRIVLDWTFPKICEHFQNEHPDETATKTVNEDTVQKAVFEAARLYKIELT